MRNLVCGLVLFAAVPAFSQEIVVRVAAIERVFLHGEEPTPGAWTTVDPPRDGWPSPLGTLLDAIEARTGTAPMDLLEVGRAIVETGREQTIGRAPITLVSRRGDSAEVRVSSIVVRVPLNGIAIVGNGVDYFAVSVLDVERAAHIVDPVCIQKDGVMPPQVILHVNPRYPEDARRARVSGIVTIEAEIDETGNITWSHAIKPIPGLTEAALDAIRQWRFQPATIDGKPVAVLFNLTINFRLP